MDIQKVIKVTIAEGTFSNEIYGGKSAKNKSNNNIVTINGGTFTKEIYGAYSAQRTDDYVATGNKVIINGGSFTSKIYGAYSSWGKVKENGVAVSGSTTEMKMFMVVMPMMSTQPKRTG